jgi:S-formylglutathione hydrolase FrmB
MPFCEFHYFSDALAMQTSANIILPSPSLPGPYSVMFLLHGLADDHTIWCRRTSIERYVADLPLIVVMPNGGRGFYCDAVEGFQYATAIGTELPKIIQTFFPTTDKWCVAGLSMGGYGAARLALDHPRLFRSATSLSGALGFGHLEFHRDPVFTAEFLRVTGPKPPGGKDDLYAKFLALDPADRPALRIDCGTEDFLLDQNRDYHAFLTEQGFEHEYEEHPGAHTWEYWDLHIQSALAFHRRRLGI